MKAVLQRAPKGLRLGLMSALKETRNNQGKRIRRRKGKVQSIHLGTKAGTYNNGK